MIWNREAFILGRPPAANVHHKQLLLHIRRLTPAEDTQTIDHGGVRVGAHQAVRIQEPILVKHHAGQVLQVDLVNDS